MYKRTTLFLFSFLFTLILIKTSFSKELCHKDDKATLLKIKESLNITWWDSKTDCCSWYAMECGNATIDHRVTQLVIENHKISGQIPPEVGDLPYLRNLFFRKLSNLTGPIQPTIAKLKNLQGLTLSWTNLTGPVPEFLGQLKNLVYIDLSFSDLSGSIPSSLSSLTKLYHLDLSRNNLTGSIPESFGSFKTVPALDLSHNQLSGPIPKSLGNLDFNKIDFSRNKLKGDASMLFGVNKTTRYVDLSRNMLKFDISNVEIGKELNYLDLNHNGLTGSLPAQWFKYPFQWFNVSYNRLCGRIPKGGDVQRFGVYSFFHNKCLCDAPLKSCKSKI